MTITGTDAFGPWIDTGKAVATAMLPDPDVDSHNYPGVPTETDAGRADKTLKIPPPTRQGSSPR